MNFWSCIKRKRFEIIASVCEPPSFDKFFNLIDILLLILNTTFFKLLTEEWLILQFSVFHRLDCCSNMSFSFVLVSINTENIVLSLCFLGSLFRYFFGLMFELLEIVLLFTQHFIHGITNLVIM